MVRGFEHHVAGELPRQQSTRQRNARQNAALFFLRRPEQAFGGLHAEHVENDLNRLHARVAQSGKRFLNRLNADAVIADLAGPDKIVEDGEDLRPLENARMRAMQLQKIYYVDL